MASDLSPEAIAGKGLRAEQLIQSEPFKEFLGDTIARLKDEWAMAMTMGEREELHARLRGLTELVKEMGSAIGERDVQDFNQAKVKRNPLAQSTEK